MKEDYPYRKENADIIFLVDTSGSMCDEIDAVKNSCQNFADKIIRKHIDVRLGLVGFDIGGHHQSDKNQNYEVHNFSTYTVGIWGLKTPIEFKKNIQTLSLGLFGGGGCYIANQDTVDIFPHVANVFDKQYNNSKILFIISDEMGNNDGLSQITDLLQKENIVTYVMGIPHPKGAHQNIAKTTGGEFWDITKTKGEQDFSKLLSNVAKKIVKDLTTKTLSVNNNKSTEKTSQDVVKEVENIIGKWENTSHVSHNKVDIDSITLKF
jgi:hypothetical protein